MWINTLACAPLGNTHLNRYLELEEVRPGTHGQNVHSHHTSNIVNTSVILASTNLQTIRKEWIKQHTEGDSGSYPCYLKHKGSLQIASAWSNAPFWGNKTLQLQQELIFSKCLMTGYKISNLPNCTQTVHPPTFLLCVYLWTCFNSERTPTQAASVCDGENVTACVCMLYQLENICADGVLVFGWICHAKAATLDNYHNSLINC